MTLGKLTIQNKLKLNDCRRDVFRQNAIWNYTEEVTFAYFSTAVSCTRKL